MKIQRTAKDILRSSHLQKELLCAAVDAVSAKSSTGGVIVYSTCSVSVAENEQVCNRAGFPRSPFSIPKIIFFVQIMECLEKVAGECFSLLIMCNFVLTQEVCRSFSLKDENEEDSFANISAQDCAKHLSESRLIKNFKT